MEEFPDLPDKFIKYSSRWTVCPTGFEIPVKDNVYIDKRSEELEKELRNIPEEMEKLQKRYDIGKKFFDVITACLSVSLIVGTITALTGMVNPISILAAPDAIPVLKEPGY